MSHEALIRNPQKLLGTLRTNFDSVAKIVDHYKQLLNPEYHPIPLDIGKRIRMDALFSAHLGCMEEPPDYNASDEGIGEYFLPDLFAAGEQIGINETKFTTKEKLDYLTGAALSRAIHHLNRVTHPRSAYDKEHFGNPCLWAGAAKKKIDLHLDGFDYEAIENVYFPRRKQNTRILPQFSRKDPKMIINKQFFQLLQNIGEGNFRGSDEILKHIQTYENKTGQIIGPELLVTLFTLYDIQTAAVLLFKSRWHNQSADNPIPTDEIDEAQQLIGKARDFMLAKVELIGEEEYGIDFSHMQVQ